MNIRILMRFWFFLIVYLTAGCFSAFASELDRQRLDFLRAEQLLLQPASEELPGLLDGLSNYPLYPYLKSQWLKKNPDQTEQIEQFLERYPNNRYADQLRSKWLQYLAGQERWPEFLAHYPETDALDLQCLFNQAQYITGQKPVALAAAKKLWLLGTELPSECNYLMNAFKSSDEFSNKLIWQRFDLALQNKKVNLAESLKGLLTGREQSAAKFWLQLHANPELINSSEFQRQAPAVKGLMFAHAVLRLAVKNPSYASLIWDNKAKQFELDEAHRQQVEHDIALALAKQKGYGAFSRLMRVSLVDEEVKEWRLRSALFEADWTHVLEAIARLDANDRALPKWRYWQSRALWLQGKQEQALPLFRQLAAKRDYYGFLAADFAGLEYQLEDHPLMMQPEAITALLETGALKIVQELRYHHRGHEAEAQWWYLIKRLDKAQIAVAAKIAQQWQWRPIDIFTVVKAELWDDVDLRFPMLYQQYVQQNAALHEVDPALVFGLIRQESAFAPDAASSVGARGLMQIMPTTGMQIARELKESWGSKESLFNPEINIKYGSYYYSKLVRRFAGHFALAAAAYNAGPKRVDSWLPEQKPVPADIWIETIPFKETRKYVSAVLTYAIIYQQRLQRNNYRIRDFMRDVLPL